MERATRQYVVDAFTERVFSGNPAAICVLDRWLPDEVMLAIARENRLSETAFAVPRDDGTEDAGSNVRYGLRWFAPGGEVDLCGHATLATAFVLLGLCDPRRDSVTFSTSGGTLVVTRRGDLLEMDFPAYDLRPVPVTEPMAQALGAVPREAYLGRDLLCVLEDEATVRDLSPDMGQLLGLDGLLVHVTARADGEVDCVSRSFAPKLDIPEDPVCGSGHCHIVPYWAKALARESLTAYQASERGGTLHCRVVKNEGGHDRVILAGRAALFSEGTIHVPDSLA